MSTTTTVTTMTITMTGAVADDNYDDDRGMTGAAVGATADWTTTGAAAGAAADWTTTRQGQRRGR